MSCAKTSALLAAAWLAGAAGMAWAADLSAIVAMPQQGQTGERARRDRYECHNWAVEQTGVVPLAPPKDVVTAEQRAERVGRVLAGASIGAAAGSIIGGTRGHRHAADGALAGGVLGAIVGAVTGRAKAVPDDEAFDAYYRALSACLGGRGYDVFIAQNQ